MKKQAFTLIEVLIATILVGLAIASLLGANLAFTRANGSGVELSTAEFLTEQIREQTVAMPFTPTLLTLVNTYPNNTTVTYKPPHDSQGIPLTAYPAYSQNITGRYVSASDLSTVSGSATPFYRITVEISLNNKTISSACWIRASY